MRSNFSDGPFFIFNVQALSETGKLTVRLQSYKRAMKVFHRSQIISGPFGSSRTHLMSVYSPKRSASLENLVDVTDPVNKTKPITMPQNENIFSLQMLQEIR